MATPFPGLDITPPADFLAEELTLCWRVAAPSSPLKDPRAMQVQMEVRPNMIAQRRTVAGASDVGTVVAKVVADLVRHVKGISTVDTTEFAFADGQEGLLLKYTIPGPMDFQLAQMQAARLDGDILTTVTITNEVSRLNEDVVAGYLQTLASTAPSATQA